MIWFMVRLGLPSVRVSVRGIPRPKDRISVRIRVRLGILLVLSLW
jgi:hypothetical protein